MDDAQLFEMGQQVLARQGFSRYIGAQLTELVPGRAVLDIRLGAHLLQQHGAAHGGVISYLIDNAIAFAAGSIVGKQVLTVELKINYLRPATGQRLIATAVVERAGATLVVCRCEVACVGENGQQSCALGQGTVMVIPASGTPKTP